MKWFIVRVKRQRIGEAVRELDGWHPCVERMTKPSGKKKAVVSRVPVFPGWVFVEWEAERYLLADRFGSVIKYGRMGPLFLQEDDMALLHDIVRGVIGGGEEEVDPVCIGDLVDVVCFPGISGRVAEIFSDGSVKLVADGLFDLRVQGCLLRKKELNTY